MKKLFFIIMLNFLSCSKNNTEICDDKLREKETIEITKTILFYLDQVSTSKKLPISVNLQRLSVASYYKNNANSNPIKLEMVNPKQNRIVTIENLLHASVNENQFFSNSDSLNFFEQKCTSSFKIPVNLLKNRKSVNLENHSKRNQKPYIKLSYPIFSSKNDKAYVEIDFHLTGYEHSYGNSILLEKIGLTWKIIKFQSNWDT